MAHSVHRRWQSKWRITPIGSARRADSMVFDPRYGAATQKPVLSGESVHGRTFRRLDPVVNDPWRKLQMVRRYALSDKGGTAERPASARQ
jgi:hypothetical protein